jgi:hypothetical protein
MLRSVFLILCAYGLFVYFDPPKHNFLPERLVSEWRLE